MTTTLLFKRLDFMEREATLGILEYVGEELKYGTSLPGEADASVST